MSRAGSERSLSFLNKTHRQATLNNDDNDTNDDGYDNVNDDNEDDDDDDDDDDYIDSYIVFCLCFSVMLAS